MLARIKEKDTVCVIAGKDKGKHGVVLKILTTVDKVVVKGCNILTKHVKARKQSDVASIKKIEGSFPLSKVMLVCSSCHKPCRVKARILEDGSKVRSCARCKEVI